MAHITAISKCDPFEGGGENRPSLSNSNRSIRNLNIFYTILRTQCPLYFYPKSYQIVTKIENQLISMFLYKLFRKLEGRNELNILKYPNMVTKYVSLNND